MPVTDFFVGLKLAFRSLSHRGNPLTCDPDAILTPLKRLIL
jgi:hypothetical protein